MSNCAAGCLSARCEICGEQALHWANIKGFDHFHCGSCKHLFVWPKPGPEVLDRFYENGDYYNAAEQQRDRLIREARSRTMLLRKLVDEIGLGRRLLDVGCASGIFLTAASEAGWAITGVERSQATADRARSKIGCDIFAAILEESEVPGAPFPVVTAWEVIEHSLNVRRFFAALARNVQEGGLLAISTPLANGWIAKLLGTRFPMLTPPEHLSIFSRTSLVRLASEFGFSLVNARSFSNLSPRSLASGLCRFGFGKTPESCSTFERIAAMAFGVVAGWIPPLIDALGNGSEMQLVFRKSFA